MNESGFLFAYALLGLCNFEKEDSFKKNGEIPLGIRAINAGDIIGYMGSTGYSSGPHLHFGFKIGDNYISKNITEYFISWGKS